jgi:cytochrome c553
MNKPLLLNILAAVSVATASFLASGTAMAQAKAGSVEAGKSKAAMCIGCHGIVGYQASFPEIHRVPMISGQSAKYIEASLAAYKSGERKHPTMTAVSVSLSEQDMADLGAFYAQHAGKGAGPDAPAGKPSERVAKLIEKAACISCHGANFNKPNADNVPKLAGQHADYLTVALKAYKTENNAKVGRGNAVMSGFAKQYSNAELKEMAKYIASLDGDLKVVPQSKFR